MQPLIDGDYRTLPEIKNKYYLDSLGNIYVLPRTEWVYSKHGKLVKRSYKEKQLKPYQGKLGYLYIGLTLVDGTRVNRLVHRLVAKAFLPNPDYKPEVNHIDGDKTNNSVSNLEWCSRRENLLHAEEMGLKRIGSKVGTSILTEEDVILIVRLLDEGVSQTEIAKMYGVSNHAIHRIAKGKNWSWLTGIPKGGPERCSL